MMVQSLTRNQVRRLDTIAIEELGIPGVVLMENAGRGAAEIIQTEFRDRSVKRVVIFCGAGNNGGDGYVVARHLTNGGVPVRVHRTVPEAKLQGNAAINYRIIQNMRLDITATESAEALRAAADSLTDGDLVVDALLGTGFHGQVRAPLADFIHLINTAAKRFTVAIDVPSGLDCDTGQPGGAAIRADLTITFVAPKVGFSTPGALEWTGEVRVIGIGAPPSLVERVSCES